MDFEHAIKMDVRNNPIVRELDQARQRELWRWMVVGGALVEGSDAGGGQPHGRRHLVGIKRR